MTFYNTTQETGENLIQFRNKAQSQDDQVLDFYQKRAFNGQWYTAEQVHAFIMPDAPLTSARRAVTNLYNQGLLEKGEKVKGKYGRPIYLWRLK